MPATGAGAARTTGTTAAAAGASHGPSARMGVEDRQHARCLLALAIFAADRRVCVLHRAQGVEF